MSGLFECIVIDPPTAGEVYARALGELAGAEFHVVLRPSGQEIPRPADLPLELHVRNMSRDYSPHDEWAFTITNEVLNHTGDISSVTLRIPRDDQAPGVATVVTH